MDELPQQGEGKKADAKKADAKKADAKKADAKKADAKKADAKKADAKKAAVNSMANVDLGAGIVRIAGFIGALARVLAPRRVGGLWRDGWAAVMVASTAGRMKTTGALAAFAGVLVLSSCAGGSGGSDAAATTEAGATVSVVASVPTTTNDAVDELERNRTVNEFLDAAEFNASCTSSECTTAQATYSRYQNLYELAGQIPGDDILPYFTALSSAWDGFTGCLSTAESRFERFDCIEESDMEQAITDLYNALR